MQSIFGRQSIPAHILKDRETRTAGGPEDDFLGIPLTTQSRFWEAPTWQVAGCFIIVLAIILQSTDRVPRSSRFTGSFWAAILAVLVATPETTLFPLLSTIVYTRTVYPYVVVIPHCIVAVASYRSRHEDDGNNTNIGGTFHYLNSLILSFFLYGFGGSIVSDLLMGLPVTALSHPRIIPCHVLGWWLVLYCPFDFVYKSFNSSNSSLRYILKACEAVDAVTTPMGRISRSARELRNQGTAPIVAGLLAGVGGASIRQVTGEAASPSLDGLESAFWKTLCYSLLWWFLAVRRCLIYQNDEELQEQNHCSDFNGSDMIRVGLVCSHTLWTLLAEVGLVSSHPFVWICRNIILGRLGNFFVKNLFLGPASNQPTLKEPNFSGNDEGSVDAKKYN
jgi:TRIC channel